LRARCETGDSIGGTRALAQARTSDMNELASFIHGFYGLPSYDSIMSSGQAKS